MMDYAISVRPILDLFTKGHLMRAVTGRFVQVMGVLVGFWLLFPWFETWTAIGGGTWTLESTALLFAQIVLLVAFVKIVQIFFARGEDIRKMQDSEYTMMSIFAYLGRLPGEVAFVFFALFSLPAMFLTWAGSTTLLALYNVPIATGNPIFAGFVTFVTCWIMGFALFVCFSLLAEVITALATIARDHQHSHRSKDSGTHTHAMSSHGHARAA